MTRYFAQNTPRAGLEHMMMSVPGFQKRGGGMMILSRFCYKPEDVDCRYCLHYRRRSCQVRTCPYIAERLKSGAIEYLDLILEYFGHIPHAGLHKRIQAVEHWSGPDQAVLHTVSVHLRSRFADRVWDDAPPGYLAALYPKFVPEDYVILRLNPRFQKGEWVQWMQEMPPGSPPELLKAAETFSNLKLGFRGDLKFQQNPEVIEVAPLVEAAQTQFLDISFLM